MSVTILCVVLAASQAGPVVTTKRDGQPGDPINLRLLGTRNDLVRAFLAAGWVPADPVTVRSAIRIGTSVALNRPYPSAPVSDLYLFGRVQDLAFERSVSGSARSRHHVRFWLAGCDPAGHEVWLGAGTFDARVGRSPSTGRLTHRISPDVDAERATILADLTQSGGLIDARIEPRSGPFSGRNGEGDCYFTDGAIGTGVLTGGAVCGSEQPVAIDATSNQTVARLTATNRVGDATRRGAAIRTRR